MAEVIRAVEKGFASLSLGDAFAPERVSVAIPASEAVVLEMPSRSTDETGKTIFGSKIVSVFPNNPERGLESVQSVYLLFDGDNGAPLALMDGKYMTGIRTAATSAVATKYLVGTGSKRLAIFGSGVQARFHVEAMIAIAEIENIAIVSRNKHSANAFAEEMASTLKIECKAQTAEVVAKATLICTCTSSPMPLFDGSLLRAGTHINAIGAFTPTTRELDTETVRRATIFIDSESAAGEEAGDILIPIAEGAIDRSHIKGTLADLVSGKISGRHSETEITVFKSCGHAIEDLMTAQLAYTRAMTEGVGTKVEL